MTRAEHISRHYKYIVGLNGKLYVLACAVNADETGNVASRGPARGGDYQKSEGGINLWVCSYQAVYPEILTSERAGRLLVISAVNRSSPDTPNLCIPS